MFPKSKNKVEKAKKRHSDGTGPKPSLSQLGLLDVPNVSDLAFGGMEVDEDDPALEAELLALTGGGKMPQNKKGRIAPHSHDLNKMIEECLRDDIDEDLSDEEDDELLAELSALGPGEENEDFNSTPENRSPVLDHSEKPSTPMKPSPVIVRPSPFLAGSSIISLLTERIQMYEEAEENALANGETSRAKRFNRGLQTMHQMMKAVKAGKTIAEDQIPPTVLLKSSRVSSANDLSQAGENGGRNTPQSDLLSSNVGSSATDSVVNKTIGANRQDSQSSCLPSANDISSNDRHLADARTATPLIHPTRLAPKPPDSTAASLPSETSALPAVPAHSALPPVPAHSALPPVPAHSALPPVPAHSAHPDPISQSSSAALSHILKLQSEYKTAAVKATKMGDRSSALQYLKVSKQLEPLVTAVKDGQVVDLDSLPSSPNVSEVPVENKVDTKSEVLTMSNDDESNEPLPSAAVPSPPVSVLEALEQRLAKYTEQKDKAQAEENTRKERQNQRIMKQYQDAIKLYKMGKPVDFEELPTPPGFPPIPNGKPASTSVPTPNAPVEARESPASKSTKTTPAVVPPVAKPPPKLDVRRAPQSRVERQLSILQKRQGQFKDAALEAKKRGEIEQAKEYLRNFKGLDQLIMATNSGLPVDMNTVPIPPQEQIGSENTSIDFEVIDKEDCIAPPLSTPSDIAIAYGKLEEDLISQIKMCAQTREHFKALGDVASANRFEQLILHTKKDLDAVRVAFKRGDTPPRFHYENRSFTIIQCNTDLNDSDCEVNVMRGINFNVSNPKDVSTYIKIEFPYPTDAPPQERSDVVKETNNPEYNHKVVFSIDRKARALARIFKRQSIKLQVIAKGAWFHRDSIIGNVKVPLVPLETQCTLHESFDIVDERKKMVGGKLEVKVRVRNPIISKQLEKVTEKWLVIDGF